ncbi:MAG: hypothetical protein Q9216_001486 [Gyalolechia sp. 2 TL-2023]
MATQAMLIADTIAGMRRAVASYRDDHSIPIASDSEESIDRFTNRGNKLKRKAHHVHERQLDRPNGPKIYKRKIEHAGYYRDTISRNPKRYDDVGDQLEDDEEDLEADAAAAQVNPYDGIVLQELLGPLTSAADLPTHPSLSTPYRSSILSNMTQETCEMVQRERNTIRGAKQLLTKLRGDEIWIPGSALDSDVDDVIFDTSKVYDEIVRSRPPLKAIRKKESQNEKISPTSLDDTTMKITLGERPVSEGPNDEASAAVVAESASISEAHKDPGEIQKKANDIDKVTKDTSSGATAKHDFETQAQATAHSQDASHEAEGMTTRSPITTTDDTKDSQTGDVAPRRNSLADAHIRDQQRAAEKSGTGNIGGMKEGIVADGHVVPSLEGQEHSAMVEGEESQALIDEIQPITHRMTTRAQAQAVSDNNTSMRTRSPSVASSYVPSIHPIFLIPQGACPDRDLGLPPDEAEATRRILMSYVQKQEEVCRGVDQLYNGLLKAGRMKKDVFDSCKAEGHVGEMSDGEDWYDKEEWGLEEDLRKGHDEEEDDAGTQHKKTRGRRA